LKYIAKYHHLDLEVSPYGDKWTVLVKDIINVFPTKDEDKYDSVEKAKAAAVTTADIHLKENYKEKYGTRPAELVRWAEVKE